MNERKQQQQYRTSFPAFRYRVLRDAFILDNGRVSTLESIDHLRKMKTIWDEHTLRALNDDASMEGNAGMTRHRRCSCAPEYIIHPELEESASSSSEMTPLLFRSEAPATANGTLHDALRRALQVSLPSPPVETARVRAFWTEHRRLMNRDDVADTTSDYTEVLGYVERTHDDRHENDDEGGISWWNTTHSRSDNNNGDDDELLKQPASLGSVHDTRSKLYRNWFGGHCHRLTQRESPGGYGSGALSRSFILRLPKIKRETSSMLPCSAVWEPPNLKSVSHYASLETAPTARSERAWWTASKGTRTTRSAGASVPMLMAITRATDSTQLNNASRLLPPTLVAELAPAGGALHRRKGRSNLSWLAERCPIYASISAWNTDDFLGNQTKEKHDLGPPPQVIVPWQYLKETRSKSATTTRFTLGRLPLSRGWDAMAATLALAPGGEGTKRHASCASRLCVASLHGKGLSAGAGVVRLTIL